MVGSAGLARPKAAIGRFHENYLHGLSAIFKKIPRQLALSRNDLPRELGVSYATINRWENGLSKFSKLAMVQLDAFCERMQKE